MIFISAIQFFQNLYYFTDFLVLYKNPSLQNQVILLLHLFFFWGSSSAKNLRHESEFFFFIIVSTIMCHLHLSRMFTYEKFATKKITIFTLSDHYARFFLQHWNKSKQESWLYIQHKASYDKSDTIFSILILVFKLF